MRVVPSIPSLVGRVSIPVPQRLDAFAAQPPEKHNILREAKDAVLDGVKKTNEFIEARPLLSATVIGTNELFKVLKSFPKFIYPSISGATPAEKQFILQTLDSLPLKDVNSIKSLSVVDHIQNASGVAYDAHVTNVVHLARDQISLGKDWFREVLIHETGHTKDYESAWFGIFHHNSGHGPWGQAPYVSDYARTSHWEDYADTHARYHMHPDQLKATAPEKFDVMQHQEKQGLMDQAIDHKAFRETGKWIGDHIDPQGLRTGIEVMYWAVGGIQVLTGLEKIRASYERKDAQQHFEGVLDVTAGTLFATKLIAMGGLAVQGARRGLRIGIKKGAIAPEDADAAVRTLSDPIERGLRAMGSKIGMLDKMPAPNLGPDPKRTRAAGFAIGGAVGGVAGGLVGPYAGILGGYSLAGPVGGAVGLVVGAIAGYSAGSSLGARAGGALAKALGA